MTFSYLVSKFPGDFPLHRCETVINKLKLRKKKNPNREERVRVQVRLERTAATRSRQTSYKQEYPVMVFIIRHSQRGTLPA